MANLKRYGVKFPITVQSADNTLIDLNQTKEDEVYSELVHLIFTPKGQRLRDPNLVTRLIQFIFNPNESETWGDILTEIKDTVSKYIPSCSIKDLTINESDNGVGLRVDMKYTVKQNGVNTEYTKSVNI